MLTSAIRQDIEVTSAAWSVCRKPTSEVSIPDDELLEDVPELVLVVWAEAESDDVESEEEPNRLAEHAGRRTRIGSIPGSRIFAFRRTVVQKSQRVCIWTWLDGVFTGLSMVVSHLKGGEAERGAIHIMEGLPSV